MRYLLLLLLTGCIVTPNWDAGHDCWRYGIAEDNTGRMSALHPQDIPVVKLGYDDLLIACGLTPEPLSWSNRKQLQARACFKPREVTGGEGEDMIYLYRWAGEYERNHERCHAIKGRLHNNCSGYGIGKDESACNW